MWTLLSPTNRMSWPSIPNSISVATPRRSTRAAPASARARSAWWRGSYVAGRSGDCCVKFGSRPPFPGDDTVLVAHYASAELGVFRALGWSQPKHVIDTFTEFRARVNGLPQGAGLIDAAAYFGIDAIESLAKKSMVALILRGPPWSAEEWAEILHYCESDVRLLERAVAGDAAGHRSAARAASRSLHEGGGGVEWNGIPIDVVTLELLRKHWTGIQDELIAEIDRDYGVFDGRVRSARNAGATG